MKRFLFCMVVAVALLGGVVESAAEGFAHTRSGFFAGFGYGGGKAKWEWVPSDLTDENQGSGFFHLRFGTALRDDLLIGFEGSVWANRWDISDIDGTELGQLTLRFYSTTIALTFFPGNIGFSFRAGAGIGIAHPQVTGARDGFSPATETGFAMLGAIGYDWRVTDKFAIGPEFQVSYLAIDGDWFRDPMLIDGSIQLNWYW